MWIIKDPSTGEYVGVEDSMWEEIEMAQYFYDEEAAGYQLQYVKKNLQFMPGLEEEIVLRLQAEEV